MIKIEADAPVAAQNSWQLDHNSRATYMKFLKSIDNTGDMLNNKYVVDHTKQKRVQRIDRMSKDMDRHKYLEFSKARCASFANKKTQKFKTMIEWLTASGKCLNCLNLITTDNH